MNGSDTVKWLKVGFNCPENIMEATSDLIGVLSGSGVEQTPIQDGIAVVTGFFRLEQEDAQEMIAHRLEQELAELFSLYRLSPPILEYSLMADEDWATSWQQFFTPFAIVPGLIIKPGWESYTAATGEQVIEMDPGMAFGTGQHASTKLALSLIQDCFQERGAEKISEKVLDIGTGTGILAMGAALFGAAHITAVDNDQEAVRVAGENIIHNRLERKITVSGADLAGITGDFDLICANIIHDALVEMAPDIVRLLAENGRIVLAGILRGEQEENIASIYSKMELVLRKTMYEDEWASLLLCV